ncbi:MAG: cation:proton antiporter [Actinomycetota bacterium]
MQPDVFAVASPDLGRILLEAFLIFTAAKMFGQVAESLRQPEIAGEILAGVILGPAVLGWIHLGEFQEVLAELGVIVLLFVVGLETRFSDLRTVGGQAMAVAGLGVAIPFALGWGMMEATDHASAESLFVGTALVATSVGVTARVLTDLGAIRRAESRVILGAAIIDDVLGLVLLAVVSGAVAETLSAGRVIATIGTALAFVGFLAVAGTRFTRRYPQWLEARLPHRNPLIVALIVCLGFSALAARIGLAGIVGAFMAGMVLAESNERYELDRQMKPVSALLVPFFFVVTGAKVELDAFTRGGLLALTVGLVVVAIAGKVVAGLIGSRSLGRRGALMVGIGMAPRGEVGIIVASIALATGTVGREIYSVVVAVSLLTTLLVPPALKRLVREGHP